MNQQTPERSRPIREWLNELPEPYRTQALVNAALFPFCGYKLDDFANSKVVAIWRGFDWSKSNEGENHWNSFCNYLMKKSLIPSKEEYPGMITAYPNDWRFEKLARLMWLRDETWRRDGNWKPENGKKRFNLVPFNGKIDIDVSNEEQRLICFRTNDLGQQFHEKHSDLINECYEFL